MWTEVVNTFTYQLHSPQAHEHLLVRTSMASSPLHSSFLQPHLLLLSSSLTLHLTPHPSLFISLPTRHSSSHSPPLHPPSLLTSHSSPLLTPHPPLPSPPLTLHTFCSAKIAGTSSEKLMRYPTCSPCQRIRKTMLTDCEMSLL